MVYVVPIIVVNCLLLAVVGLLFFIDRTLSPNQTYTISVEADCVKRDVTVPYGVNLMSVLAKQGFTVPSSCNGQGTCGCCKVKITSANAHMNALPIEWDILGKREIKEGMRLCCQVSVTSDMQLSIPDFLDTVRSMVKLHKYKTNKLWSIRIG